MTLDDLVPPRHLPTSRTVGEHVLPQRRLATRTSRDPRLHQHRPPLSLHGHLGRQPRHDHLGPPLSDVEHSVEHEAE
jgi:hypothetical protein